MSSWICCAVPLLLALRAVGNTDYYYCWILPPFELPLCPWLAHSPLTYCLRGRWLVCPPPFTIYSQSQIGGTPSSFSRRALSAVIILNTGFIPPFADTQHSEYCFGGPTHYTQLISSASTARLPSTSGHLHQRAQTQRVTSRLPSSQRRNIFLL